MLVVWQVLAEFSLTAGSCPPYSDLRHGLSIEESWDVVEHPTMFCCESKEECLLIQHRVPKCNITNYLFLGYHKFYCKF